MARPPSKFIAIRDKTKADMISLGIYEPEFDEIIRVYAKLKEDYFELQALKDREELAFRYIEILENGTKKDTKYAVLETMRKDILAYSSALGLTPAGLKKIKDLKTEEKRSPTSKLKVLIGKAQK